MKISKKICLIGDESVGKTSISMRFADDQFSESYKATIGVKLFQRELKIDETSVNMIVWDIQGGKELISSPQQYYRAAHGLIFVCDISNPESIENISFYQNIVKKKYPTTQKILLLNKTDLINFSKQEEQAFERYKESFDLIFKTSAKNDIGITTAFTSLASRFIS